MRALFERISSSIRGRLVDSALTFRQVEVLLPQASGGSSVRIRYRIDNQSGRRSFVALGRPWGTALPARKTQQGGPAITPLQNGWSVEVAADAVSEFEIEADWANLEQPIRVPLDLPEPIRDLSRPTGLIPIMVQRGNTPALITGLAPSQWSQGLAFADISAPELVDTILLDGSPVEAHFLGRGWLTEAQPQRLAVAGMIDGAFSLLFEQDSDRPRGSIGVALAEDEVTTGMHQSTTIAFRRRWLRSATANEEVRAEILWQVAGMIWTGLTRVHGMVDGQLLFALRLQALGAASKRYRDRLGVAADFKQTMRNRFGRDLAGEQRPEVVQWYERAFAVGRDLDAWCVRQGDAPRTLARLSAELYGKEVECRWLERQLKKGGYVGVTY